MVTIYPSYGHTLTMVFFKQYYIKLLHKQANYGEKNRQLSLFSQAYDMLVARSAYISQWLLYTQVVGKR